MTDTALEPVTKLRHYRKLAGMTIVQLSALSGISQGVISRIENATDAEELRLVGVGKFLTLAGRLGVTAATLYPPLRERQEQDQDE